MRIVVISPFAAEREALEELLRGDGHDVVSAPTRAAGLLEAQAGCPDLIIADAQVPGLDGLAIAKDLSACAHPPRVILLCPRAHRSRDRLGVACLIKPIDLAELLRHIALPTTVTDRVA